MCQDLKSRDVTKNSEETRPGKSLFLVLLKLFTLHVRTRLVFAVESILMLLTIINDTFCKCTDEEAQR